MYEMLRVFWYIDVVMCVIYTESKWDDMTGATLKTGRCRHRHGIKRIQPTEDSRTVAARQLSNMHV